MGAAIAAPFFLPDVAARATFGSEAKAPRARVCVPGGSDIAARWEPERQHHLEGGEHRMAKKMGKGGKKKGGKKR